jgi:8-oxo-dGTP pyrophosphatase MutT (NUDIX family)
MKDVASYQALPAPQHDPNCSCGYRIVRDLETLAKYVQLCARWASLLDYERYITEGVQGFAFVRCKIPVGGQITYRDPNDPTEPEGTIRVSDLDLGTDVLLPASYGPNRLSNQLAKRIKNRYGVKVHRLPDFREFLFGPEAEYAVERVAVTDEHALRISDNPGRDGSAFHSLAGHRGLFGSAGILLKTAEPTPHYLLQQRSGGVAYGGSWAIPGGSCHEDETPGETAARELSEEMGIHMFTDMQVMDAVTLSYPDWTFHTIIAECRTRPVIRENEEVAQVAWLTRDEVLGLAATGKCHPLFKAALDHLLQ